MKPQPAQHRAHPTGGHRFASLRRAGSRHAPARSRRRLYGWPLRAVLLIAGCLILVVGAGGSALAYWRDTGAGAGSATTGTPLALTLTPGTPIASLFPGGRADVALVLSNPNANAVTVASLALATTQGTGGFAVDAGHPGCATTVLSYATQTNAGAGWSVPGRTGTVDGTLALSLTNAVAMDVGAADACQGAIFSVYLVAGP